MLKIALGLTMALSSQSIADTQPHKETITIAPGPIEEYRENTIAGACDGSWVTLRLVTTYRNGFSVFSASSNGLKPKASSMEQIERLLLKARGLVLLGFQCHDRRSITVGISGSYVDPASGEDDDFVRFFEIQFD